jgi:O-Antigen ligase
VTELTTSLPLAAGILAVVVIGVVCVWWSVPALRAWPPSLGLMLCVATLVPPHATIAAGLGTDDVPVLLGLLVLAIPAYRAVRAGAPGRVPFGVAVGVGATMLASAMVVSSVVNAGGTGATVSMLIRSAGRVVVYALVVVAVLSLHRSGPVRRVVTAGLVAVATLESVISLLAYTIGLPGDFGLQPADGASVLVGEVPGRAIGTTSLASNFLAALLVLTIPLTLGWWFGEDRSLAPLRAVLAVSLLLQVLTLVFTYTRVSLVVTALAVVAVGLMQLRSVTAAAGAVPWRRVLGVAGPLTVLVVLVFVTTPLAQRLTSDGNDRLALYDSAVRVFVDHPVAGVGPGEQADVTAADPVRYRSTSFGVATANAHNTVLLAAAENGVLGLVGAVTCTIGFAGAAVVAIRRAGVGVGAASAGIRQSAAGVALLAFLVQGMTNNLYTVTFTATAMLLVLAACVWEPATSVGPS